MSTAAPDARMRLPREPYPGLRPFLDFEAALLFGRERQVREVLEHLKQTQFVAVLGGSGSGKSSLIHAGVMPALRSYGIPGAGDLWLPMTCTPGTNVAGVAATARLHTPITRLARRFAALLDSRGSEAADAARQAEIAEVFRQPAGFARLIDQYGAELAVPPGPDRAEARVLFVLDQFEELFHPTNRDVDDVKLLVERVLDHFFSPHERCHVVITMRSEHLNDCASFLELPDAINKSSYLVRRLDADELREAITGPAQRFLRLMSRQRGGSERSLPAEVRFEPTVVERLLRDVQALAHDPDHLPLLQHLLARLWEAALEREDLDMPVPHQVTLADLQRAVAAGHAGLTGTRAPLAEDVNTLRACVEHWPETLYQWHDEAARPQLDALFRQLAYKDPNTGLYSQQRIDVDRCESFMGAGSTRADLRALVAEGFLGGVDYLFWDDDDPSRVTLKVSHESFIRGWRRFRELIDAESAHFEEFVGVLRKAAEWALESRAEDYLLETAELRRLADSGFLVRLRDPNQREAWRRFLRLDRDGGRLGEHEPLLEGFVDDSLARQAQRRRRTLAARRSTQALIASTVLFALLPTALFAIFVQGPTMRRAEQLFEAGNRADRLLIPRQQPRVGSEAGTLDSLLRAAELVETARLGVGSERLKVSHWLLSSVGELPPFRAQRDFLESVFVLNEPAPRVNEALMDLMSRAVWSGGADATLPAGAVEVPPPDVERGALCFKPDDPDGSGELRGLRFMSPAAAGVPARSGQPRRAVFVPDTDRGSPKVEVYSALVDPVNGLCLIGDAIVAFPVALQPRIAVDRQLRNFYVALAGPAAARPVVLVQQIDWERGVDGRIQAFGRDVRVTLTDPRADGAVRAVTGDELAAVLPTWRVAAGVVVSLGGRYWRLVSREGVRVEPEQPPAALPLAAADSACASLASDDTLSDGVRLETREADGHCLLVRESGGGLQRRTVELAVHAHPVGAKALRAAGREPTPLLGYVPFTRVPADDVASEDGGPRYAFGRGAHEGWVLMRLKSPEGRERWVGAPWSTCALWRLGRELQQANPPAGEAQAGESPVCLASSTPP